jgi:hypothetical protein
MRRTFGPLLSVLVLASLFWQWGHLSTFDLRLARVKKEIKLRLKAGVSENERAHFSFSPEEFSKLVWVKPDREFRLGDRFYDVVERWIEAEGTVHFACIDDRQESQLFADLKNMVERSMDTRSQGRSSSAKIIALWKVFFSDAPIAVVPSSAPCSVAFGAMGATSVLPAHARLEDPPPRA